MGERPAPVFVSASRREPFNAVEFVQVRGVSDAREPFISNVDSILLRQLPMGLFGMFRFGRFALGGGLKILIDNLFDDYRIDDGRNPGLVVFQFTSNILAGFKFFKIFLQ